MNELEKILVLVQELELDMIEKGHISDDCVYTDNFGKIKELLYKESIKDIIQIVFELTNKGYDIDTIKKVINLEL
jgi:hypothetical protein